jgi:hypothetical protein
VGLTLLLIRRLAGLLEVLLSMRLLGELLLLRVLPILRGKRVGLRSETILYTSSATAKLDK